MLIGQQLEAQCVCPCTDCMIQQVSVTSELPPIRQQQVPVDSLTLNLMKPCWQNINNKDRLTF